MISTENRPRPTGQVAPLRGRLALVAGAETAIGHAVVHALQRAGTDLIAGVDSEIPHAGFPEHTEIIDVDASDIDGSISRIEQATGSREIELFLSATASVPEADALLVYPQDLERTLSAHLYLPFAIAQHVASRLVATMRQGVIVLIGSETQPRPAARTLARGVACAAAAHMAHCLAGEWRAYGIRTHMLAIRESDTSEGARTARAEDVAANALYLLSEAGSSLAVGHDLVLDLDVNRFVSESARSERPNRSVWRCNER